MAQNLRNGVKSVSVTVRLDADELKALDSVVEAINAALQSGDKRWTRSDVLRSGFLDNKELYERPPVEIPTPGLSRPIHFITILRPVDQG